MGPIRTSDPVDRGHPLNLGRVAWWLALPHTYGGAALVDLCNAYPAALQGFGPSNAATAGWRAAGRPGALAGGVLLDGANAYLLAGATPYSGPTSFATWLRHGSTRQSGSYASIASHCQNSASDWFLYLNSSDQLAVDIPFVGTMVTGATSVDQGWHRVGFARSGSPGAWTYAVYLDGKPDGTGTTSSDPTASAYPMGLGCFAGGVSLLQDGLLDDAGLWARGLTAADFALDFDLSSRGYPAGLNRRSPARAFLLAATSPVVVPIQLFTQAAGGF